MHIILSRMLFLKFVAAVVLFLQLPIPLYWFVVHPLVNFWRSRPKAAYTTGLLCSWLPVTIATAVYRRALYRNDVPPSWQIVAGFALIIFEGWIFWRVKKDLGGARLVGKTELSGAGEIARSGIYARIRHPRYAASFLAIVGACLIAGTKTLWIVSAIWCALTLVAILLEERELRARFGDSYKEYCRAVPRFLPSFSPSRRD